MGKILLYYKYIAIEDPHAIKRWQQTLCQELGLTGRILIGVEGINGTVGGSVEATNAYIKAMHEHPFFSDVSFKSSPGDTHHFPRLRVAVRDEIVTIGISPDDLKPSGPDTHLTPSQVHDLLNNKPEDLLILDTRNNYESRIGTFRGAITPDIENFRDFPEYIEQNLDSFKDKQVLMFCTGGVRCDATLVLAQKHVAKKVFQITGGIHSYAEEFPDGHFRGKNYVFDGRVAMKVNDDIVGTCHLCTVPYDEYTNCINVMCNLQFLGCPQCRKELGNTCSSACQALVRDHKVEVRTIPKRTENIHGS